MLPVQRVLINHLLRSCTPNWLELRSVQRLQLRAVHSSAFIILFLDGQIWKLLWHDPARLAPGDKRILGEVCYAVMVAKEVLVQHAFAIDILRRRSDDREYSI